MLKPLATKICCILIALFIGSSCAFATGNLPIENSLYLNKTKLLSQQMELLKSRIAQAKNELERLQRDQITEQTSWLSTPINKQLLNQANVDIAAAKSNRDSVGIELAESQQTISRLEKETQEIENQLNLYSIFGLKSTQAEIPNLNALKAELEYQKDLLDQERTRATYLQTLQTLGNNILQLNKARFGKIEMLLKSQNMLQIKERQARSEINFQQQQGYWLGQLNSLYAQLNVLETMHDSHPEKLTHLQNQIFYANENLNYAYLQMLIARYNDQIRQFKISIAHSTSITLLNKVSDESQLLGKQLIRVNDLLKTRISILEKRKLAFSSQDNAADLASVNHLVSQYKKRSRTR